MDKDGETDEDPFTIALRSGPVRIAGGLVLGRGGGTGTFAGRPVGGGEVFGDGSGIEIFLGEVIV